MNRHIQPHLRAFELPKNRPLQLLTIAPDIPENTRWTPSLFVLGPQARLAIEVFNSDKALGSCSMELFLNKLKSHHAARPEFLNDELDEAVGAGSCKVTCELSCGSTCTGTCTKTQGQAE